MCSFGYEDCLRKSVELFDEWMDSAATNFEYNPIDPSIRATVYCKVKHTIFYAPMMGGQTGVGFEMVV